MGLLRLATFQPSWISYLRVYLACGLPRNEPRDRLCSGFDPLLEPHTLLLLVELYGCLDSSIDCDINGKSHRAGSGHRAHHDGQRDVRNGFADRRLQSGRCFAYNHVRTLEQWPCHAKTLSVMVRPEGSDVMQIAPTDLPEHHLGRGEWVRARVRELLVAPSPGRTGDGSWATSFLLLSRLARSAIEHSLRASGCSLACQDRRLSIRYKPYRHVQHRHEKRTEVAGYLDVHLTALSWHAEKGVPFKLSSDGEADH